MTGVDAKHVSMYANREKIKLEPDGRIDIALPVNRDFLRSRDKAKKVEATESIQFDGESEYEERRKIELQMKKRDLMIKDIHLQKLRGELMPTPLIYSIYQKFFEQVFKQTHYETERWLNTIYKRHRISKQDQAKYHGQFIDLLNEVIDKTKEECVKETEFVVKDFSSNGKN